MHGRAGVLPEVGIVRVTRSDRKVDHPSPHPHAILEAVFEGINVLKMSTQLNNQQNVNLCSEYIVYFI